MKNVFKIIISAICIAGLFTPSVYASEVNTQDKNLEVTYGKTQKLELADQKVEDLHQDESLNMKKSNEDLSGRILNSNEQMKEKRVMPSFAAKAANSSQSLTRSFDGTIEKEGSLAYYPVTLGTNQILQTSLKCPNNENLDYDLYLYKLKDDGTLGDFVDSSTTSTYFNQYPDGSKKTLDEGLSYINKENTNIKYAVIVYAKKGGSTTDKFNLTISLDVPGAYDQAEPNDSPYKAYTVNPGTLSGANLNVSNDQDWYVWNVPNDFSQAEISVDNGYKVEVYTANGSSMVLRNGSNNIYNVSKGYYYIKVFNDSSNFTSNSYSLKVNPTKIKASKLVVDMNGDQGKDFPSYPGSNGKYLRFKNTLSPTVYLASENNYAVSNCPVTLDWTSESWTEQSGNRTRSQTVYTGSDGSAVFSLTVPTSLGYESYTFGHPVTFTHYFDIDSITISAPGVQYHSEPVFHFAYSDYVGGL